MKKLLYIFLFTAHVLNAQWVATGSGLELVRFTGSMPLTSSPTNSTTTFEDVTGLFFTAEANTTYLIRFIGAYQSAATTTGIAMALDVPSGATVVGINHVHPAGNTVGGTYQVLDATTKGTASVGVATANEDTPIVADWLVTTTTLGVIQLKFRSEIATSAITMVGGKGLLTYIKI